MPWISGAAAPQQRAEDAGQCIHPGGDIGDRNADPGWLVRRSGDADQAGLRLDQQVVSLLVAVGAVGSVARDVADDDRRLLRREHFIAQAEARGCAGSNEAALAATAASARRSDAGVGWGFDAVEPEQALASERAEGDADLILAPRVLASGPLAAGPVIPIGRTRRIRAAQASRPARPARRPAASTRASRHRRAARS